MRYRLLTILSAMLLRILPAAAAPHDDGSPLPHAGSEAADTTLFFDPIFHKHGYTFEDYDASVRHYVRDPEKFGEIMERVKELLREQTDIRQSVWERKVDLAYRKVDFFSDSLWSRDWLTWAAPVIDTTVSLVVVPDSADVELSAPADSLSPKTVPLKLELQ